MKILQEAIIFDLVKGNPEDADFPAVKAVWQHQPFLDPHTCHTIERRIELHLKKKNYHKKTA